MTCKLDYIENLQWDNTQEALELKEKLNDIHGDIAKRIKVSDLFRNFEGRLRLRKPDLSKPFERAKQARVDSLLEAITEEHKLDYVTLVDDPTDDRFYAVKIDTVSPNKALILKHLTSPDITKSFEDFESSLNTEDFLEISNSLFGHTDLGQKTHKLSEEISKNSATLTPILETVISRVFNKVKGLIPSLEENSIFFHKKYGNLKSMLWQLNENRDVVSRTTAYIFNSIPILNSLEKSFTGDGNLLHDLNSIEDINLYFDIENSDLNEEAKDAHFFELNRAKTIIETASKKLVEANKMLTYFDELTEIKAELVNAGIKLSPYTIYNSIELEDSLLDLLENYTGDKIKSIEYLTQALSESNSETGLIDKLKLILTENGITVDFKLFEDDLITNAFEPNLKRDSSGKPLEHDLLTALNIKLSNLQNTKNKIGEATKKLTYKVLYDLYNHQMKDSNMSKEDFVKMIENGESDLSQMEFLMASSIGTDSEVTQLAGIFIHNLITKTNLKQKHIASSIEKKQESLTQEEQVQFSNDITFVDYYIPQGTNIKYAENGETGEHIQTINIHGVERTIILEKGKFFISKKMTHVASMHKRFFDDNISTYTDRVQEIFDKVKLSDVVVKTSQSTGEEYIDLSKSAKKQIEQEISSVLEMTGYTLGYPLKYALIDWVKNKNVKNTQNLFEKNVTKLKQEFQSRHFVQKTKRECEQILKDNNIDLATNASSGRSELVTLEAISRLEQNYFITYDAESEDDNYAHRINYGYAIEHDKVGYIFGQTDEGVLIKIPFKGEKGNRTFEFPEDVNIVKYYTLQSGKFSEANDNYTNDKYVDFLENASSEEQSKYVSLFNEHQRANKINGKYLSFNMVAQVPKAEVEKTLKEKLNFYSSNPKELVNDLMTEASKKFSVDTINLENQTKILRANANYTYRVYNQATGSSEEAQVNIGDYVDYDGKLLVDENGDKVSNEKDALKITYYGIGVNGEKIKDIPSRYVRKLEVEDLEENMFENVKKFSVNAQKHRDLSLGAFQTNLLVETLKGNSELGIKGRTFSKKALNKDGFAENLISRFGKQYLGHTFREIKMIENDIETNIYGNAKEDSSIKIFGKEYDLNSATGVVKSVIAFQNLAGNIVAPISNLAIGEVNTLIMSLQGNVLDSATYWQAQKFWAKQFGKKKALTDIFTTDINQKSMLGQTLLLFNAIQGTDYNIDEQIQKNGFGLNEFLFFTTTLAEYKIQGTLAIGMLMKAEYQGETVFSILERLYKQSEQGDRSFTELVNETFSTQYLLDLTLQIQEANRRCSGNYSKTNKSILSRYAIVSLALVFKRWIYDGIVSRYRGTRKDLVNGREETGYHSIFLRNLYKGLLTNMKDKDKSFSDKLKESSRIVGKAQLKTFGHVGETLYNIPNFFKGKPYQTLDMLRDFLYDPEVEESDIIEMSRASMELTIFLSSLLLGGFAYGLGKGGDGDEDDNQVLIAIAYYLTRLQNDTGFFLPYTAIPAPGGIGVFNTWDNAWKVIKDPFTVERTLDNNVGLLSQLIGFYEDDEGMHPKITEQYKKDGTYYNKGDYKIFNKMRKTIAAPIYQIMRFFNFDEQMKFLEMTRKTSE